MASWDASCSTENHVSRRHLQVRFADRFDKAFVACTYLLGNDSNSTYKTIRRVNFRFMPGVPLWSTHLHPPHRRVAHTVHGAIWEPCLKLPAYDRTINSEIHQTICCNIARKKMALDGFTSFRQQGLMPLFKGQCQEK